MRFTRSSAAAALVAALPLASAQTSTDCDPTKKTCAADVGLSASTFNTDFTQGSSANASWSAAAYTTINYGSDGAEFTINESGQAPTIQTDFYVFFGRVEVKMKAAPGTGIVSSIVLESDDLDEIDWEFLGGNTAQVETNFFGKGNTTAYDRAIYYSVETPQDTFHTYTVDWTPERLEFIIDGTTVRTLAYTDALTNGGQNYPQTPMRVKLGNWAGGADGEPKGTVEWAGGSTDFSKAPFTMVVASVAITNYNPGSTYTYSDLTGSYGSIKIDNGSTVSSGGSSSSSNSTSSGSVSSGSASSGSAPTSSISVEPVMNTKAVVSTTLTGSPYSTNTESVSAQNSAAAAAASTEVATQPTASGPSGTASGTASHTSSSGTTSQTGASDAMLSQRVSAGSLLGAAALCFWML